jgi:hypothetical protein
MLGCLRVRPWNDDSVRKMATSPNSALLLGVSSTAAAQRARVAAASQVLEDRKASALAAERYEDCAVLRDALVPLRAQGAEGVQQPLEAALLAALRGRDAPAPTSGTSPLHPRLRSAAWRADNRYFSAEVDLLALPPVEEEPSAWVSACSAVLSEPGPAGASKRRCQALVAVVDAGTDPESLAALAAMAEEAEPELLLLCELGATPAPSQAGDPAAAAEARETRLARLGGDELDEEGPLWEWSIEHGFEHVVLPWYVATGVPEELLSEGAAASEACDEAQEGQQGLGRVVEALQNTMWGTLDMKPQPEQVVAPAAAARCSADAGELEPRAPAGNSALIVSFVRETGEDGDDDHASGQAGTESEGSSVISSASIAAALGLGSEYGSVPAVATWRVRNRYFSADIALRFIDAAASNHAGALDAARTALAEQSPAQSNGSSKAGTVPRCGAVVLILSEEMGKAPAGSALLAEWSDLIAKFPYPDGSTGPEMLALCVNSDAAPYAPAIEWCADHGYELIRPPAANVQDEQEAAQLQDSSGSSGQDGEAAAGGSYFDRGGADKEGVYRLVEALQQNVWRTVRMHEQAGPSPAPQSDSADADSEEAASSSSSSSSSSAGAVDTTPVGGGGQGAVELEELLLLSGAAEGKDGSGGGGGGGGSSQQAMPDMEEMFREVSRFKASSSSMSREQRHAAAERIALSWGLGGLDGDGDDSDDSEGAMDDRAELEKFLSES